MGKIASARPSLRVPWTWSNGTGTKSTSMPALAAAARTMSTANPVALPSLVSTNGGKWSWNAMRTGSAACARVDQTDTPAIRAAAIRPATRIVTALALPALLCGRAVGHRRVRTVGRLEQKVDTVVEVRNGGSRPVGGLAGP